MIIGFENVEGGAKINADICIVGAGAAGITIARALSGTGLRVCLLESGGLDFDDATQALYSGEEVGHQELFTLTSGRLRYFGGSTNHWGGWCGPLTELDFQPRDWIPHSGWPLRRSDLDPYYARAHEVCELGPYIYDPPKLERPELPLPKFDRSKLSTRFWRYSTPTRFGQRYRDELKNSDAVQVYLHANLLELTLKSNGNEIGHAVIGSLSGRRAVVNARVFVLACGGIENARILLLQNHQRAQGLGNEHDLVGRFYTTHPHIDSARALPIEPQRFADTFVRYRTPNDIRVQAGVCVSDEAQRREGILNSSVTMEAMRDLNTGYLALKGIVSDIGEGKWPDEFMEKLGTVINDFGGTVNDVYDRLTGDQYEAPVLAMMVFTRSEQAPNRDSRVFLGSERDVFGQRRITRDWRLSRLDKETIQVGHRMLGEELGRLNLGRLRLNDWLVTDDAYFPDDTGSYGHHLGTTRMADSPREGVVNADCRVHSVANLFIAGSSVFPTGGYMNPTLTIVAFALRLADHLTKEFS